MNEGKERMIQRQKQAILDSDISKLNTILRLLDKSYKVNLNTVKFDCKKEDGYINPYHELAKSMYCLDLYLNDKPFITNAIFLNGKRADIIDVLDNEAIEITFSESDKSITNKEKSYPIPVRKVSAEWIIENFFLKRFILNKVIQ